MADNKQKDQVVVVGLNDKIAHWCLVYYVLLCESWTVNGPDKPYKAY